MCVCKDRHADDRTAEGPTVAEQLFATLNTNRGAIRVELYPNHAPKTVANFVELAEGTREWKHPGTGETSTDKLYDGTTFHRVISGFMIQGGDPLGTGTGGPGYRFGDEFHPELTFSEPYLLAMANAGPGTNGSQFFITEVPTPHLDGRHTVFGHIVAGKEVIKKLANVPRNARDCPLEEQMITKVHLVKTHIEFHLGGGGYGTFADLLSSPYAPPPIPQTETAEEARIKSEIATTTDPSVSMVQ